MTPQNEGAGSGNPLGLLLPIVLTLVVFYLLLLRPEQRRQRQHQEVLNRLKKGDQIVTSGGIIGRIVEINPRVATIEVGNKVRIEILRSAIRELAAGESEENK